MTDYKIPDSAKWIADFINRIGFPIFVAVVTMALLYMQMTTMKKSGEDNAMKISEALDKNTAAIVALRHFLTHKYDD